jgi:hypothetical protein
MHSITLANDVTGSGDASVGLRIKPDSIHQDGQVPEAVMICPFVQREGGRKGGVYGVLRAVLHTSFGRSMLLGRNQPPIEGPAFPFPSTRTHIRTHTPLLPPARQHSIHHVSPHPPHPLPSSNADHTSSMPCAPFCSRHPPPRLSVLAAHSCVLRACLMRYWDEITR